MSGSDRRGLSAAKSFQPSSGDKLTAIPGVLGLIDPTNDRRGPRARTVGQAEKWQVILTGLSLGVTVIALVGQFAQFL